MPNARTSRACTACGSPFSRRPGEELRDFRRRKKCQRSCGTVPAETPTDRTCAAIGCGRPLSRGRNENMSRFLRRRTCGPACGTAARFGIDVHATPPASKICDGCRRRFVRHASENRGAWFRRRTCCRHACVLRVLAAHKELIRGRTDARLCGRQCATCRKELTRHPGESGRDFAKRTSCGLICYARRQERTEQWCGVTLTLRQMAEIRGCDKTDMTRRLKTMAVPEALFGMGGVGSNRKMPIDTSVRVHKAE